MGFRFVKLFLFLCYTVSLTVLFYHFPIQSWLEKIVNTPTQNKFVHLEGFQPIWKERTAYTKKSTLKVLEHLHKYNPLLPTDYEFHLDESKQNQVKYFNKTKHIMSKYIYERLRGKENGFFIECGAYDGLWLSNTAWLERTHNWTGLLVEVDPNQSSTLKKRNRKAWIADVCLSTEIYPTTLKFTLLKNGRTFYPNKVRKPEPGIPYLVKCYPLHMLLDAIGVSEVDYFSLDVEGVDLAVLKTIPWHRIKIKLISVEILNRVADATIRDYLEAVGYRKIKHIDSSTEIQMDDVYELVE